MKFIFASLLCAVVSAAPLVQDKPNMRGTGVGGAKRGQDEHLETRQTGDVAVRLDQPAVELSLSDEKGQVAKRQTLTSLLGPLLGGKAGGKKRDVVQDDVSAVLHTAEHALPDPNDLKASIGTGRGKYQVE